jgi:hypothetical protein
LRPGRLYELPLHRLLGARSPAVTAFLSRVKVIDPGEKRSTTILSRRRYELPRHHPARFEQQARLSGRIAVADAITLTYPA